MKVKVNIDKRKAMKLAQKLSDVGTENMADDILRESMRLVPVDTGELKASGSVKRTDKGHRVHYEAPHALFIEYGTSRQTGTPFLRPSVERTRSKLSTYFRR